MPRLTRISAPLDGDEFASVQKCCISGDGEVAAFITWEKGAAIYVHDERSGMTERVTLFHQGQPLKPVKRAPSLSHDGQWIAFLTSEDYWGKPWTSRGFVCDWRSGAVIPIDIHDLGVDPRAGPKSMSFAGDMRRVIIELASSDTSDAGGLYLDRERNESQMLSCPSGGSGSQFSISADGRFITFLNCSARPGLPARVQELWLLDLQSEQYQSLPLDRWADDEAFARLAFIENPRISSSGRYVAVLGSLEPRTGPNTPPPTSVLLVDRSNETVSVVSRGSDGLPADSPSYLAFPSESGACVIFASNARKIIAQSTNSDFDIFSRDLTTGRTECISRNPESAGTVNNWSFECEASADGRAVVFWSQASNLVPDDRNDRADIFLWQR